jgi:hypothetical protein
VLIMAEARFHLVMVPLLAVFAVQGVLAVSRTPRPLNATDPELRRATRRRVTLSVLIIVLLLVNWAYELNTDMDKLRILFAPGGNLARFTY